MRRLEWVLRFGLTVVALVLLWLAQRRYFAWRLGINATMRESVSLSLQHTGLVVLAGFVLGIAARLPKSWSYRLGPPTALGVIPLLMLAQFEFLWYAAYNRPDLIHSASNWFSRWFFRAYFFNDVGPHFAVALMLGVAVSAGFGVRGALTGHPAP
jgi:hypothetical protein